MRRVARGPENTNHPKPIFVTLQKPKKEQLAYVGHYVLMWLVCKSMVCSIPPMRVFLATRLHQVKL